MKKLFQVLGLAKPTNGDFGIEVEVEGRGLKPVDNLTWGSTRDGSLRGEAYEYVTKGALSHKSVPVALKSLNRSLKDSELSFSFRTSVHVHLNVQDMDRQEIATLIYLYYIFEGALINYCGKARKGNRFCLRLQDAEEVVYNIRKYIVEAAGDLSLLMIPMEAVKYAALNIASLSKFGSLEFRGMRGTLDVEVLSNWTTILMNMKQTALHFKTPKAVYDFLSDNGIEALSEFTFREQLASLRYPRFTEEVMQNFSLSIEIPFMRFTEEPVVKEKKKKVVRDPLEELLMNVNPVQWN